MSRPTVQNSHTVGLNSCKTEKSSRSSHVKSRNQQIICIPASKVNQKRSLKNLLLTDCFSSVATQQCIHCDTSKKYSEHFILGNSEQSSKGVQNCPGLIWLTTSVPDVWTERRRRRRICTHASGVLKALSLHRLIIK